MKYIIPLLAVSVINSFAIDLNKYSNPEDINIIKAIFAENRGDYRESSRLFLTLFEMTHKEEYIKKACEDAIEEKGKPSEALLNSVSDYLLSSKVKDREYLARELSVLYFKADNEKKALKIAQKYLSNSKDKKSLLYLALIYDFAKEYEKEYEIFRKAYELSHSSKILLKEARILYKKLNRKDEAKELLESYIKMNKDIPVAVYLTLIDAYLKEKSVDNALRIYEKLYEKEPKRYILKRIINLYIYNKDIKGAERFLERHLKNNEDILYDIYKLEKNIPKAIEFVKERYRATHNPKWLAEEAMLRYEGARRKGKITTNFLKEYSALFNKAIESGANNSLYLNYYGYTLIDHDLDIKKGLELVKRALKQKPNSFFYLDSLAWGLYKEGKCKEAQKIMEKVKKLGGLKEKEIKEHYEKIKECNQKG